MTVAVYGIFSDIKKLRLNKLVLQVCLIISMLCFVQALYGIAQYICLLPAFEGHRVTGSFDNPAGFAASLCAGFPVLFYFILQRKSWIRYTAIAAMLVIVLAVCLSASRAGIIGLSVALLSVLFYKLRINARWKIAIVFMSLLMLQYFLEKKMTVEIRQDVLFLILFLAAGIFAGELIHKKVNESLFKKIVFTSLLLIGIIMVF